MAKKSRNALNLDMSGLEKLLIEFDELGGDVESAAAEVLEKLGEKIGEDTVKALDKPNLPHQGIYSTGRTEKNVVRNPKADISGNLIAIEVGFNYGKPGAGGYLIKGTPRMKPDIELQRIYGGWAKANNRYKKQLLEDLSQIIKARIAQRLGGQ